MSRKPRYREQVYAVIRVDDDLPPEHAITVKEVVRDLATAEAEVARLNAAAAGKRTRYEWQATRLYDAGYAADRDTDAPTTEPGYTNRHGQRVIRETGLPGNDHNQSIYVLQCGECGLEYGANGSDIFERRCPRHQGGQPGLEF